MQVRYFVAHQGRQIGPMEFTEIETRLDQKRLFPTDYVYVTEDKARWLPILEFILVYGPKRRVMEQTLLTDGAKTAADADIDWHRFASGLPIMNPNNDPRSNPEIDKMAYPTRTATEELDPEEIPPVATKFFAAPIKQPAKIESPLVPKMPDYPPPPKAPRAIIEKRILEAAVRKSPATMRPPIPRQIMATKPSPIQKVAPAPAKPTAVPTKPTWAPRVMAQTFRPSAPPQVQPVDVSATAQVDVLPPRATKLHIQINGEARVGEILEVTVHAMAESGALDHTFDEIVHLGCNRPVQGLAPLQFTDGIARLQVRCLASGQHQFFLSLDPTHKPGRHLGRGKDLGRELAH